MQNIGEQDSGVKSEKLETSGLVESGDANASDARLYERVQALRGVRVFADLPEEQLRWFAENAEERRLEAGDILFSKGDPP
ncbi:MAG: hypothetical protein H0T92_06450, partial [Pyrinomonadaceae bacterium]|nr:hypothetical protein [Pyrinomonadaceae bacterium]